MRQQLPVVRDPAGAEPPRDARDLEDDEPGRDASDPRKEARAALLLFLSTAKPPLALAMDVGLLWNRQLEPLLVGQEADATERGERRNERDAAMSAGGLSSGEGSRTLLPGFGTILFAAQLNLMLVWSPMFLNDPGTGWHLRAGRLMLEQGHWINADPFSFTHGGEPWVTFEWLSEVIFALVERAGGLGALVFFGFSLFALVPFLLFRWLIANQIPRGAAFTYAVTALIFFQGHALARPHVLTYLALVVSCLLVGPRITGEPERRHWLTLPPLFALWANLHGGFVAGFLWLGARLAGLALDRASIRGPVRAWSILLAVSAAATLVNPHGIVLHEKIWHTIVQLKTVRYWDEFMPPDFYTPSPLAAVVLAIVFLLLVAMRKGALADLRSEEFVPTLVFLFFAFKSQRHVFLLMIVASVPVCRAALSVLPRPRGNVFGRLRRFSELERQGRGDWWAMPLTALLFAVVLAASGIPQTLRVGEKQVSKGAADFLAANLSSVRRPLTTTTTGGPLLYYFFPDIHVSFDDRSDFYGDRVNSRFLRLFGMGAGWQAAISEERFDSAILPPDMPLAQGLALLPGWREVYRDDVVVVFFGPPADAPGYAAARS